MIAFLVILIVGYPLWGWLLGALVSWALGNTDGRERRHA